MSVRTTLTLDEDVATKLAAETRRSGRPFRAVVNQALRAGLDDINQQPQPLYQVRSSAMDLRAGVSLDGIEALLDELEGPAHS